jgi:DNA-binding transcriptional regulator YiaG
MLDSSQTQELSRETLRKCRVEHRLTQEELADMMGIDHSTVSRWETGVLRIDKMARHFLRLLFSFRETPKRVLMNLVRYGTSECE